MSEREPDIGPDTKLAAVLERWPDLLGVLLALSDRFRALEHPFLRQTFGRAATLRQVAMAGGVPAPVLLARLREAAGLPPLASAGLAPPPPAERPAWASPRRATSGRDVRPDVQRGVHPLKRVVADLEGLGPDEVYELITPLVPAPLIGLARKKGFEACPVPDDGYVRTYVRRLPG